MVTFVVVQVFKYVRCRAGRVRRWGVGTKLCWDNNNVLLKKKNSNQQFDDDSLLNFFFRRKLKSCCVGAKNLLHEVTANSEQTRHLRNGEKCASENPPVN